jgi:hypothetical protein
MPDGRARILVNPRPEDYRELVFAINPDMKLVRGVDPYKWALSTKGIVAPVEQIPAEEVIKPEALVTIQQKQPKLQVKDFVVFFIGALLGGLVKWLIA